MRHCLSEDLKEKKEYTISGPYGKGKNDFPAKGTACAKAWEH